ncbi:acyl-CoA thioesterase/bile acid-CoA:amino acid N-acyltransferase family protein [Falsibacillus albus]|uniref:Acyl-CoA thioesterase n=1 Tax=Falsibacillus albus TaxID=2478915 RepID=A0A3L7K6A6_9BACI|nr:acyl-CoA thioesterase/bile acid-CoA:amino acid N-acyltransferase family protein [Falsibacillus albus]RLQ96232.1 hypothetical protein D9X91_08065 [Falsibacillus albus]
MDEKIHIKANGLKPHQECIIRFSRRSITKQFTYYWESYGHYAANQNGQVDINRQSSIRGSYEGVDGMGLFWSMTLKRKEEQESHAAYEKLQPYNILITLETDKGKILDKLEIQRLWKTMDTQVFHIRDEYLVGNFYFHKKKAPAIIVVGGSEGGIYDYPAALLASRGFHVLALAYWGEEHLPERLTYVPLERIGYAIQWLKNQSNVSKGWIGIHGTSRGGELVLWSAHKYHSIKAAVSLNGSAVSFAGIVPWTEQKELPPAWMFNGHPLPYASPTNPIDAALHCLAEWKEGKNPLPYWYRALCRDKGSMEKAIIPISDVSSHFLLICGKEDAAFDSLYFNQIALKHDINQKTLLVYENAGHETGIPYIPIRADLFSGGTKEGTAAASVDSWRKTIEFFQRSAEMYT